MFRRGRGRRGGFRGRSLTRRVVIETRRQRKAEHSGTKFTPPADPSTIVWSPWNNLTVELSLTSDQDGSTLSITYKAIMDGAIRQTGLSEGGTYEFRLFSVRAWNISGGEIALQPEDQQGTQYESLIADYPGRNHWARIGYVWSIADRTVVRAYNATAKAMYIKLPPKETAIFHINIVWRPNFVMSGFVDSSPVLVSPSRDISRLTLHRSPILAAIDELSDELSEIVVIK